MEGKVCTVHRRQKNYLGTESVYKKAGSFTSASWKLLPGATQRPDHVGKVRCYRIDTRRDSQRAVCPARCSCPRPRVHTTIKNIYHVSFVVSRGHALIACRATDTRPRCSCQHRAQRKYPFVPAALKFFSNIPKNPCPLENNRPPLVLFTRLANVSNYR